MEPGAEPEPTRRRERSLTAKRSLLDEYDKADYKARHELLDREQLTIRQVSRWRSELRMAARKKAARRPSTSATAGKKATSGRTTSGSSPKTSGPKTAAKRTKAPASATKRTAAPAEPAAADDDTAPADDDMAPADDDMAPASAPAGGSATAKPAAGEAAGDRGRPRRTGARSKAADDDDVAVVHAEALIYHTAALDRLLAARTETGPSAVVLTRLRSAAREAHGAAWAFLEQVLKADATRPAGSNSARSRRPWWGAKDAPPPPPPAPAADRRKRWGR
jgi:hypothetical protein